MADSLRKLFRAELVTVLDDSVDALSSEDFPGEPKNLYRTNPPTTSPGLVAWIGRITQEHQQTSLGGSQGPSESVTLEAEIHVDASGDDLDTDTAVDKADDLADDIRRALRAAVGRQWLSGAVRTCHNARVLRATGGEAMWLDRVGAADTETVVFALDVRI